MDGRIWVESEINVGSKFLFEIPYMMGAQNVSADNGLTEKPAYEKDDQQTGKKEIQGRVLLVEDVHDNRVLIQIYLKDEEIDLDFVVNGQEAINKYKESLVNGKPYSLILMDIQMPVISGYEATKNIREIEKIKQISPVTIIALTAHALQEESVKSLESGCNEHVTKPIRKQVLLDLLQKYLRTKKQK